MSFLPYNPHYLVLSKFSFIILPFVLVFSGCVTEPPRNIDNVCSIFKQYPSWHRHAKKSSRKYRTDMLASMAIIYQESSFKAKARPPFRWWFIIPRGRASTAYGYAQALDGTWQEYLKKGKPRWGWKRRSSFKHSIDFVSWYNAISKSRAKIGRHDAGALYLAYHDGHGGYLRGTYNKKPWLKRTANKVDARHEMYKKQYNKCF